MCCDFTLKEWDYYARVSARWEEKGRKIQTETAYKRRREVYIGRQASECTGRLKKWEAEMGSGKVGRETSAE
jgi:hypothetical protein